MHFSKYHALGNDYLVMDARKEKDSPSKRSIQLICHRNYGLGSDGILYGPWDSDKADFGLRIFNPDGSEAEKSGNGLRIFARYLYDQKLVRPNKSFTVDTLGGVVSCIVSKDAANIGVEMGKVSFNSQDIPMAGPPRLVCDEELEVGSAKFRIFGVTIGNPHCVIPLPEISPQLAKQFGPEIETHEMFPNRTNVQFMKPINMSNIQIEIWERGAGYTLASGSSSSAAAAVAYRMGACKENITVRMPGGKLHINISPDYSIEMAGPATQVGEYEMSMEVLKQAVGI